LEAPPPVRLSSRNGRRRFSPLSFAFPPLSAGCAGTSGVTNVTQSCHAQTRTRWSDSVKQSPGPSRRDHNDRVAILAHHGTRGLLSSFWTFADRCEIIRQFVAGNRYVDYFGTQSPRPTESSGASTGMSLPPRSRLTLGARGAYPFNEH